MNRHLPNWLAAAIGTTLVLAGIVGFALGMSYWAIIPIVLGLVMGLSRKPVPKKRCPQCDENIRVNAKVCKHCKAPVFTSYLAGQTSP